MEELHDHLAEFDLYLVEPPEGLWEGTQWAPAYRLYEISTNLPIADFDTLDELRDWLKEADAA